MKERLRISFGKTTALLFAILLVFVAALFGGAPKTEKAAAYGSPSLKCYEYDVEITVNADRTLNVRERIDVEFLKSGFTMFYKSLPKDSIYTEIAAACEGNDGFSYYVEDNPDYSEFLDICCVGGAQKGNRWTYDISYTMEMAGEDVENGMRLDVVGFGTPFELNDVRVTINFPEKPLSCLRYTGAYGTSGSAQVTDGWMDGGKTLVIEEKNLPLTYNDTYGEYMAQGITLEFTFEKGVLDGFGATRVWTERTWIVFVLGLVAVGLSVLAYFIGKKSGEIVSVVNLKAPKDMDPMQMGYLIDGSVNNEDVTSMIYYFASKGYLTIDFSDEKNPVLIRSQDKFLPNDAPAYQKTLYNGLFKGGREQVCVSELTNKYYESVDTAKLQLAMKRTPRYDKKSVLCFLLCTLAAALACFLAPILYAAIYVSSTYAPFDGIAAAIGLAIAAIVWWVIKDLQFKSTRKVAWAVLIVLYALAGALFVFVVLEHMLTEWEKFYLCAFAIASQIIGYKTLSRTEKYNQILGDILGFKDFIVVTEEDKIKFMLEENPELYYDILPYAQVLGVTSEWEKRFENILIEPPKWAVCHNMTYFDYMLINRSMRVMSHSMISRPQESGSKVGRSGGGGFGGFSGGGRGGGGFGAR